MNRVDPPSVHNPSDQITQVVTVDRTRLAHLSGQVAWDAEGRPVGPGDHEAQAAQIARNLDAALTAVGATRNDIIEETVYVVDYTPKLLPAIFGPLRAGVSQAPASTLVGVPALFAPEYLLEVQVVAALPGGGSHAEPYRPTTPQCASVPGHPNSAGAAGHPPGVTTNVSKPRSPAVPGRTQASPSGWSASPWRPWRRWERTSPPRQGAGQAAETRHAVLRRPTREAAGPARPP
ncbi:RidA family protein [Streptomyces smyrnaeus]|uniref:RidA family protein n=1 Tax=Streptomyces smyrnaeus TaxID=1387713 RepID=UPI0033E6748B